MKLTSGEAFLFSRAWRDQKFGGSLLQLEKQDICVSPSQFEDIQTGLDFSLNKFKAIRGRKEFANDHEFFSMFGFNKIESMGYSEDEGASILHDLNLPVPESLKGQFDVIYDGSTITNLFNIPQALKNIHDMLKDDGIIIHTLPSNNHVDQGYYMLSPTLLHEYYLHNKLEILQNNVFVYQPNTDFKNWTIVAYEPEVFFPLQHGAWQEKMLGVHIVARKNKDSTNGKIPQQGTYADSRW